MYTARLLDRVQSAKVVCVGQLFEHNLTFYKISKKDGSGKCDAEYTESKRDYVFGVVYDISDKEKATLDRVEGLGTGYDEKQIQVSTLSGGIITTQMYFATRIDISMKPYHWYKHHVLMGARQHQLPLDYIRQIESVESIDDPDENRCIHEMKIYR
jgi:gamma-glutamylcyclotransferase